MDNKNDIDRILYLLGEENTFQELNNSTEVHEFSEKYKKEKMKMIKNHNRIDITSVSNRKGMSRKKIVVLIAAITATLAISATAYGAVKQYLITTNKNEKTGTLTYDIETEFASTKLPVMKAVPGYLPEGFIESKNAQGKYHPNGDNSLGGITIVPPEYTKHFENIYVSDVEETIIGGVKAQILTREGSGYNHIINLFYEEGGYVLTIYGEDSISLEELIKVAENIKCEAIPGEFIESPSFFQKVKDFFNNFIPEAKYTEPPITVENIFNIGEEKNDINNHETNPTYTVNSIEVLEKLPELDKSGFYDYNEYLQFINEDGTLKDYERINEKKWENNKMNTITETIGMKYVYVTLTMKNPLDEEIKDVNINPTITFLKKTSDNISKNSYKWGGCELHNSGGPFYFDQSDYEGRHLRHFYFCDFAPKEAKEIHLVYAVDEDRLDSAYICFNLTGDTSNASNYIKVTK